MRTKEETRFIASYVVKWEYVGGENRCVGCGKWQHEGKHEENCVYGTILKAVNHHDELVDALEDFLSCIGENGYFPAAGKPRTDRLRAILTKIGGE
jgi:hypothetical protein